MRVVAAARPPRGAAGDQTDPGDGNPHRRPGAEQMPRRDRRPPRRLQHLGDDRSAALGVNFEVIPYALPFKEPYVTARGTLTRREMVLLRVRDEDGVEGLGEAVPLSLRGGVTLGTVVEELKGLAETPPSFPDLIAIASGNEGGVSREVVEGLSLPALCAVTTAAIDLKEKREGDDAWHAPVRCNATLVSGEPAAVAAEAERWAADGFGTFKLKVGAGDDAAQVAAVRKAVGPEARIRLDANGAWSLAQATEILAAVEPLGIELVEQPVETIAEAS